MVGSGVQRVQRLGLRTSSSAGLRRRLVLAVVLAGAFGATLPAPAAADPHDQPPPDIQRPPTPKVTSLGVTARAKLDGWCWRQSDGSQVCTAGTPGRSKRAIPIRAGRRVTIDARRRALAVEIAMWRRGVPLYERRFRRASEGERRWRFRVPLHAACAKNLTMVIDYRRGSVGSQIRLRPHYLCR